MKINAGFTLIEVLIAVLVLGLGLLGLASLQATGLSNNQGAYNRSQAAQLAYDITDRMRTNRSATGNYLNGFMAPLAATCRSGGQPCADCGSATNMCNPAQLAQKDLYDWNSALTTTLPSGAGNISRAGAIYTVTVSWTENRDENADNAVDSSDVSSFSVRFQL
jgi:type IV pilus assembly protein PilV